MFDDNPKTIELAQASLVSALALPASGLMVGDGDRRLDIDPATGLNIYGCSPLPKPDSLDFASSTASTISLRGMEAAEALRRTLLGASIRGRLDRALQTAANEIKTDILSALGFHEQDGVTVVLAASGTTATLIATHLCLAGYSAPSAAVIVGSDETGRGITMAATGRHPGARTPLGRTVKVGGPIAGFPRDFSWSHVAIRYNDLRPLPIPAVTAAIAVQIRALIDEGRRPILHAIEGSKTGLSAPGFAGIVALRKLFPDLAIIVDACQWRGGSAILRRYIEVGCLVIVTGSKFFGGPAFSGAVLLPSGYDRSTVPLAKGLADYSWRGDWPVRCDSARLSLHDRANPGLLLRWQAALAEVAAFDALPAGRAGEIVRSFRSFAEREFGGGAFALVPMHANADEPSSIVTFAVRDGNGGWLGMDGLTRLYRLLIQDLSELLPPGASAEDRRLAALPCHIGQPVAFSAGPYPAALRLSIGARLAVAAHERGEQWLEDSVADIAAKLRLIGDNS
jgi:hypothetical protein